MLDLFHAGRDELIGLVLAQRDALADRDRRVADPEAGVEAGPPDDAPAAGGAAPAAARGMPGLKPGGAPARAARPRQRRARGFVRRRMAPTAQVVHALARCPGCGAPLAGGTVKRTREVIE